MRTISAMDLRRRLGEVLDQAAAGERIVVERDRRPLAVLVPYGDVLAADESDGERRLRVESALAALHSLGKRIRAAYPDGPDAVTVVRRDRDHAKTSDNVRDHGR